MIAAASDTRRDLGLPTVSTSDQDRADFVEYVHARQQGLLRFAYLLSGDHHTSEDLVQTALAKTYLTWHRLRDRGAVDSYVRRIIVNEHAGLWRRAWKRNERPTGSVPEVAARAADAEVDDTMWTAIQNLPKRQRAAVVLRYYEDLSEAETARILNCSIGTVKSQTSRGLAALRTSLASNPDLPGGGS
jgi:RNA polymerase sigma-70 factor (sigma-E family)